MLDTAGRFNAVAEWGIGQASLEEVFIKVVNTWELELAADTTAKVVVPCAINDETMGLNRGPTWV